MDTVISIYGDAQTSTRHSPERPDLPTPVSSAAIKATGGTQGGLTGWRLRGGFGQGGVQGAQPALHHTEALGEARLLPLQQLLHLPDGGQELLPAEAALRGRGSCSAGGTSLRPPRCRVTRDPTCCTQPAPATEEQELCSIKGPLR